MHMPKYTIVAQRFEEAQTVFRLQKLGTSEFIERTAQAFFSDMNLVDALSSKEAYLIGYVSAAEKAMIDISSTLPKMLT